MIMWGFVCIHCIYMHDWVLGTVDMFKALNF